MASLVGDFRARQFVDDGAPFHRVAPVGHRLDDAEVLLDEEDRRPEFVVDGADVLADLVDDRGLDALAGFVQQEQVRVANEALGRWRASAVGRRERPAVLAGALFEDGNRSYTSS